MILCTDKYKTIYCIHNNEISSDPHKLLQKINSTNRHNEISITKVINLRSQYNLFNNIMSALLKFEERSIIILIVP